MQSVLEKIWKELNTLAQLSYLPQDMRDNLTNARAFVELAQLDWEKAKENAK